MRPSRVDKALWMGIAGLSIALAAVIADALRDKVVKVGDKAPDFEVVTDDGRRVSRSQFGGKVLLVNFWATWCPPCLEELPSLNELQKQLGPQGLVVLGISVDKNGRAYEAFIRQARLAILTARDPDARISSSFGTYRYPETYVIDSRGRVLEKHIGARVWTEPALVARLRSYL